MTRFVKHWGRLNRKALKAHTLRQSGSLDLVALAQNSVGDGTVLPHGMGRSYGDNPLNEAGLLLQTTARNNIISFDKETGVLRAQSGITLDEIIRVTLPFGWFIPVSPGTKFVSLGGAIANDVHGKNHHVVGSLGGFITALSLIRSDRDPVFCSPSKNKKLFALTIGGLGLTGLINWAEIQLIPVKSAFLDVENIPYDTLDRFFDLSDESAHWDYSVAWVDCFAPRKKTGRGIFTRARFSDYGGLTPHRVEPKINWPLQTPSFLLNRVSISMFNALYRWRPGARYKGRSHYDPFFYPLDAISNWNRLYGRKGFYQHQCLIPLENADAAIRELLELIKSAGQGSFLAVLKRHGLEPSPGVMSFCNAGPGVSLALDFANKGEKTRALLSRLDACVTSHGGRLYIAKDAHMSAETFQKAYPKWPQLEAARDPAILSDFWRRVNVEITESLDKTDESRGEHGNI